jgi:hypothetical protein
VKFKRGDLVRIGWVGRGASKKPLLGLVISSSDREVICRAFFNRLEYVVEPHQIEKVS